MSKKTLIDKKVNTKSILASLWTVIMVLYLYNDIFSLFKPGALQHIIDGNMGPFPVSQMSLFSAALLMAVPAVMIFLSLVMKSKLNRIVNLVVSTLYIIVMIASLLGEWYFYMFMGVVEIVMNILIIIYAIKWPSEEN